MTRMPEPLIVTIAGRAPQLDPESWVAPNASVIGQVSLAAGASAALIVFSLSLTPYLVADSLWFWLEAQGRPQVPMVAM